MPNPVRAHRFFPSITERSFDIGRFALPNPDDRVNALNEFMESSIHCSRLAGWLHICIPRGDTPSLGDLYMALHRVLAKGPVRFQTSRPSRMRRHWNGMLVQQIGFLKGTACRTAQRYRARVKELTPAKRGKSSSGSGDTDRKQLDPPAPPSRLDAAPSTVDAARRDLVALVASMELALSPIEHTRLRALVRLIDVTGRMPSQREVAREVGCSKSSISNLLAKIRELALDDVCLQWCQSTRN